MSVSSFVDALVKSELDFTNVDIADFISHFKACARVLERVSKNNRKSVRERKFKSMYSKQLFESMKFDSKYCSEFFQFSDSDVQIDICIRKNHYYVSVCGSFRPKEKALEHILALQNFNFDIAFDFPTVKEMKEENGIFSFYGGDDFPVDDKGLKRIRHLWFVVLEMYFSSLSDDYV